MIQFMLRIVTFRVRRSRGKMYIDHGRLCDCVSVPWRILTLLHVFDQLWICRTTSCTTNSTTNLQIIKGCTTSPEQIHSKSTVYDKCTASRHVEMLCNKSTTTRSPQQIYNQAQSEYKHVLANILRSRYVAIATQPVHRLQIRPIVHNQGESPPFPQVTSGFVQQCRHAAADRHTDTHTETRMTTKHFASSTTHAKCNKSNSCTTSPQHSIKSCSVLYNKSHN